MGSEPNLSAKLSVTIDTIVNFDSDFGGHWNGDGTYIQAFTHCKHLQDFCIFIFFVFSVAIVEYDLRAVHEFRM